MGGEAVTVAAGWTTADYALMVSLCSAAVSLASLGWNIWSKFIYPKPRLSIKSEIVLTPNLEDDVHYGNSLQSSIYRPEKNTIEKRWGVKLVASNSGPIDANLYFFATLKENDKIARRWLSVCLNYPRDKTTIFPIAETQSPNNVTLKSTERIEAYLRPTDHKNIQTFLSLGFVDEYDRSYLISSRQMKKLISGLEAPLPCKKQNQGEEP